MTASQHHSLVPAVVILVLYVVRNIRFTLITGEMTCHKARLADWTRPAQPPLSTITVLSILGRAGHQTRSGETCYSSGATGRSGQAGAEIAGQHSSLGTATLRTKHRTEREMSAGTSRPPLITVEYCPHITNIPDTSKACFVGLRFEVPDTRPHASP